jgi:hypothetical protein
LFVAEDDDAILRTNVTKALLFPLLVWPVTAQVSGRVDKTVVPEFRMQAIWKEVRTPSSMESS